MKLLSAITVLSLMMCSQISKAQSGYDPHSAFDPTFLNEPGSVTRSASGAPGPMYWQNHADYKIAATLDTIKKQISGTVEITYTNNSPDELKYLWLQLDQNLFTPWSRGHFKTPIGGGRFGNVDFQGGYTIGKVTVMQNQVSSTPDTIIT